MKAVNTGSLEALICDAAKRGYNRQIDLAAFDRKADPDGIHVIQGILLHEHKAGKITAPHMRCRVLVKQRGTMRPAEAWLDIFLPTFIAIPDTDVFVTGQEEAL